MTKIYQKRWQDRSPHTVTSGQWYDWETITGEQAVEIQYYIDQGKDQYQLRVLEPRDMTEADIQELKALM